MRIEVDITNLKIGQSIHVSQLTPPEGCKFKFSTDYVVAFLAVPEKEEVAAPVAAVVAGATPAEGAAAAGAPAAAGAAAAGGEAAKKAPRRRARRSRNALEARRRPWEPRPRVRAHAPQRRLSRCRPVARPRAEFTVKKFASELAEGRAGGERVWIMKPQSYMNRSGEAVGPALHFWKLGREDLVVVHDDLELDRSGSSSRSAGATVATTA